MSKVRDFVFDNLQNLLFFVLVCIILYAETNDKIIPLLQTISDPSKQVSIVFDSYEVLLWFMVILTFYLMVDRRKSEKNRVAMIENLEKRFDGRISFVDEQLQQLQLERPTPLKPIDGTEEVYKASIETLNEHKHKWQTIRVYAPVGLWKFAPKKKVWFENLAKALSPEGNRLSELNCVYGIPPHDEHSNENLDIAEDALKVFEECPDATFYMIPPAIDGFTAAPGLGMIIFDEDVVAIALAVKWRSTVVDMAIAIEDSFIAGRAREWFDNQVWRVFAGKADYAIKDESIDITLKIGLKRIRELYRSRGANST